MTTILEITTQVLPGWPYTGETRDSAAVTLPDSLVTLSMDVSGHSGTFQLDRFDRLRCLEMLVFTIFFQEGRRMVLMGNLTLPALKTLQFCTQGSPEDFCFPTEIIAIDLDLTQIPATCRVAAEVVMFRWDVRHPSCIQPGDYFRGFPFNMVQLLPRTSGLELIV